MENRTQNHSTRHSRRPWPSGLTAACRPPGTHPWRGPSPEPRSHREACLSPRAACWEVLPHFEQKPDTWDLFSPICAYFRCSFWHKPWPLLPEVVAWGDAALFRNTVEPGEGVLGDALLPGLVQVAHPADLDAQDPALQKGARCELSRSPRGACLLPVGVGSITHRHPSALRSSVEGAGGEKEKERVIPCCSARKYVAQGEPPRRLHPAFGVVSPSPKTPTTREKVAQVQCSVPQASLSVCR